MEEISIFRETIDKLRGSSELKYNNLKKDGRFYELSPETMSSINENEFMNAFSHAYISAKLYLMFGEGMALRMGYLKEIESEPVEIHNFGGRKQAFLDTNRDLWNNRAGIEYAKKYNSLGCNSDEIAEEIYKNLFVKNSDFIIEYKKDTRRWNKNANEQSLWKILRQMVFPLPKINMLHDIFASFKKYDLFSGWRECIDLSDKHFKKNKNYKDDTEKELLLSSELKYIEEDYNKPVRLEDMDEEERNDFLEANPNLRIKPVEYQKLDGDNIRDVTYKVLSPKKFRDYINVLTVYNEYKAGEKRVSYGRDEAGLPRLIAAKKDLEGNFTSYMLDIGRITIEDCPMTEERFDEISRYIADELKEALGNYSFRRKRA